MPCCNAVLDFFNVDTIIIHDFCCNAALMGGNLQSFFLQNYCFTVLFVSFCVNHSKLKEFYPSRLIFRVYMRGPKITMETMTHLVRWISYWTWWFYLVLLYCTVWRVCIGGQQVVKKMLSTGASSLIPGVRLKMFGNQLNSMWFSPENRNFGCACSDFEET